MDDWNNGELLEPPLIRRTLSPLRPDSGTDPPRRKKRNLSAKKRRHFRENWLVQEANSFSENMIESPLWLEAYNEGVVEERLNWVRTRDPDRRNWLPLFMGAPGPEAEFALGNRISLEPEEPGECDNVEFGSQTWERDLESMYSKLDIESEYQPAEEFWGGLSSSKMANSVVEFALSVDPTLSKKEVITLFELVELVEDKHVPCGRDDAIEWADGFTLPEYVVTEDAKLFEDCKYNWETIIKTKRDRFKEDRLTVDRVRAVLKTKSVDRERLKSIAGGFSIPVDSRWKSNHSHPYVYPKCAPSFEPLAPTVMKLWFEDWKKGHGFFLTDEMAHRMGVNCSGVNWTPKANKKHGRPISNLSKTSPNMEVPLNTDEVKDKMKSAWGEIRHPVIETIVRMILKFHRDHPKVRREDLELWMIDLAGAFTLLDVKWEDVRKLGINFPNGLVWVTLVGLFGWTGMPFVFDVVTRICRKEFTVKGFLASYSNWYCDDGAAIGSRHTNGRDIEKAIKFIESLFGSKSMCREKNERGRVLNYIGYLLNLDTWTISVKEANLLKALRCFFSVDVESTKISLKMAQRLGSLASRYGKVVPYFMPFVRAIWDEVKMRHNWGPSKAARIMDTGKVAVNVIRSFLVGSVLDKKTFSRSLDSFEVRDAHTVICEYDACLTGIGITWYTVSNGRETPVASGSWSIHAMQFEKVTTNRKYKSANQNRAEFLAGLIAILGLKVLGLSKDAVLLRGDSRSALSWAYTWRFNGESILRESMFFIYAVLASGTKLVAPKDREEHVKGEKNTWCDLLSRRFERKGVVSYSVSQINASCQKPSNKGGSDKIAMCFEWDITPVLNLCMDHNLNSLENVGRFWRILRKTLDHMNSSESHLNPCNWNDAVASLVDRVARADLV